MPFKFFRFLGIWPKAKWVIALLADLSKWLLILKLLHFEVFYQNMLFSYFSFTSKMVCTSESITLYMYKLVRAISLG